MIMMFGMVLIQQQTIKNIMIEYGDELMMINQQIIGD